MICHEEHNTKGPLPNISPLSLTPLISVKEKEVFKIFAKKAMYRK
jgi:hypothetical protein